MAVHVTKRKRDGATVYRASYFNASGRRTVEHVRTVPAGATATEHKRARSEAESHAHKQRAAVENQEWKDPHAAKPERLTFKELTETFLKNYRTRSGRLVYYVYRLKPAAAFFGNLPAGAVSVRDVDRYRVVREDAVAVETVRKDLTVLSTLYRWAKARGLVQDNPADPAMVKRPPKPGPDPHPLSQAERVALLDACPGWLRPIVELGLETGADRGELLRLNWTRHVDRERELLIIPRGKTGVGRTLPYGQSAAIRRVLASAGAVRHVSGAVFLRAGAPVHMMAARSAMEHAWRRAGITKPRPWKALRATFATTKAEAGVDVPTIARLMGLRTSHVLEHYINPSGAHLAEAMGDLHRGLHKVSEGSPKTA